MLNRKAVPVIRDVKQNEEQFSFEIINKNIGNWQRATLYVEDPLEEEKIILGTGSVNQHGEEEKVVISLSLKDEKIIKNLYARRRQVFILYENNEQQVILNGKNVNGFIRTEEVGNMASATSVYPVVRTKLVELQRKLAESTDVIMDGRDIGTCVLPKAQVKIYLTASSKTRAQRRYDELTAKGVFCDFDEIEKDIIDRDYRDMHRETSPLKQAEDAVLVDSSEMDIDEVVEAIRSIYEEKKGC